MKNMSKIHENNDKECDDKNDAISQNIVEKCLKLCADYLGGVWLRLTIDEVVVNRLSGGLTNQLYYCAVNEEHRRSDAKEPQEVALKLYQEKPLKYCDNDINERLTDVISGLMVARNGLGPKIYGVFKGGEIQHFYEHKCFKLNEQNDPELVEQLARVLARIHSLNVPLKKTTSNWIFDNYDNFYRLAKERFDLKTIYEEYDCKTFRDNDLDAELEWIKQTIVEMDSPKTFAHNDFRGSNIMVTESDGIVLCDFEFSCYGYRGYDFGTLFIEWFRTYGHLGEDHDFVDDTTVRAFLYSYIDESTKLLSKRFCEDNRNSVEQMVKEVKVFTLTVYMLYTLFTLQFERELRGYSEITPFDKRQSMVETEGTYRNYHKLKQRFIDEKCFHSK